MMSRNSESFAGTFSLALLMISLLLDLVPRFHLGDSGEFLVTEIGVYLSEGWSWVYGLIASFIIHVSGDLSTLAIMQILVAWASAILVARAIAQYFELGRLFTAFAVLVLFLNPLGFFWARAIMADTIAAGAFGCLVAILLSCRGILTASFGVFVLSAIICAIRSVYAIPLLFSFGTVTLISMALFLNKQRARDFGFIRHPIFKRYATFSLMVLLSTLSYASINRIVHGKAELSLNYQTHRFMVSAWSPAMKDSFAKLNLPEEVKQKVIPLEYKNRLQQAFVETGLVDVLSNHIGGYQAALPVFRELLEDTVKKNLLGLIKLIATSWSDYINPERVLTYHRERRLTGTNNWGNPDILNDGLIYRLQNWGVWQHAYPELPQVNSLGLRYYATIGGYWALILAIHATIAPFIYLSLPLRSRCGDVLAVQLFAFAYMAMVACTSNELVTRYLIPLDIPLLVTLGAFLKREKADKLPSFVEASETVK
jgi:hypothetical protein